jgi:hypothetical protein
MGGALDARSGAQGDLLAVFNGGEAGVDVLLPQAQHGSAWRVVIDSDQPDVETQPRILRCKETLQLGPRSTVLLESADAVS